MKIEHVLPLTFVDVLIFQIIIERRMSWQRSSHLLCSTTLSPRTSPTTMELAITHRVVLWYNPLSLLPNHL